MRGVVGTVLIELTVLVLVAFCVCFYLLGWWGIAVWGAWMLGFVMARMAIYMDETRGAS